MTAPTPAVERAARALGGLAPEEGWPTNESLGGGMTGTRDDEYRDSMRHEATLALTAALTDPDDPDSLARTLFVLWAASQEPGDPAFGATEATIWWSDMPESDREHWRAVADGLRMMLTGQGS